ncbi:ester cyclase [Halopenitus persicus]|uniref:ester cyclase n=1 Tax=Halopenitus persicus TaxID=1048396 RepID=UPI000BBAE4B7|nr:ester cyclase [Halopenitus persicus]
MATTRTNKELFRRVFDALNDRDFDAFADTHADDVVLHDHDEEFHGVEAVTEHEQALYEAFPDMKYTPKVILAEDDRVAARWTATGTHEGELEGIPPTGTEVEFPASGVLRVEDGKITEVWLTYDQLGMLQQLGVVESPGE